MPTIQTEVKRAKKRAKAIVPSIRGIVDGSAYRMKVYVTNNAYDITPVWEDATLEAMTRKRHIFTNTEKSASEWGVAMKIQYGDDIDNIPPTLTLTQSEVIDKKVKILANAMDESGILYIELPDGSKINGDTATYIVDSDGTYTFKASDFYNNITTESIDIRVLDEQPPVITLTKGTPNATTKTVPINVKVTDNTGISQVKIKASEISGGEKIYDNINAKEYNFVYNAHNNMIFTFEALDYNGNIATETIQVTEIYMGTPNLSFSYSPTTNSKEVTITATATDSVDIKRIKLPDGTYVNGATATYKVTENGVYSFEAENIWGGTCVDGIEITNIVKVIIEDDDNVFIFNTKASNNTSYKIATLNDRGEGTSRTNWGDGTEDNLLTHTYSTDGEYKIVTKHGISTITGSGRDSNFAQRIIKCEQMSKNITNGDYFFAGCTGLRSLSAYPTALTSACWMFAGCSSLTEIPITLPNSLSNGSRMFNACSSLTVIITLPNGIDATLMFNSCSSLTSTTYIPNTVLQASAMYANCTNLKSIDSSFISLMQTYPTGKDSSNTRYYDGCFAGDKNISSPQSYNSLKASYSGWF